MHFDRSHDAQGHRPGNKPAQGTALGKSALTDTALKGRNHVCRPFRALSFFCQDTQGVALGWLVCAPLVLVPLALESA